MQSKTLSLMQINASWNHKTIIVLNLAHLQSQLTLHEIMSLEMINREEMESKMLTGFQQAGEN